MLCRATSAPMIFTYSRLPPQPPRLPLLHEEVLLALGGVAIIAGEPVKVSRPVDH
jgi:hypothetical protein